MRNSDCQQYISPGLHRVRGSEGERGGNTREIDGSVVVGVDFVDHVLKLRLGGVLSQTPHHGTQLLGGDLSWKAEEPESAHEAAGSAMDMAG